jgi:hypothetical protein
VAAVSEGLENNDRAAMSKTTLNFLLDSALLLTFMTAAVTAVIVRFVFPPGTQADGSMLWGASYDAWVGFWFNILATMALMVLVHVMLHWSWVCGVVAQRLSKRCGRVVRIDEANQTVYGVGLLVVLFMISGAVIAAAALGIRDADASREEQSGQVGVVSAVDDG